MIVGIAGRRGSGKNTVASALAAEGFMSYSLAQPIKDAVRILFDWGDVHVNGELKEKVDCKYGVSPRYVMQSLGTDWGQDLLSRDTRFADTTGRRLWVKRMFDYYDRIVGPGGDMVVSDVRFVHEAQAIQDAGGVIIRVWRSEIEPNKLEMFGRRIRHILGSNHPDCHASELEVNQIAADYVIVNDGSVLDVVNEVGKLVDRFVSDELRQAHIIA